jgi:hypothetical protein
MTIAARIKMKGMANALGDHDEVIHDRILIHHGLNAEYDHTKALIKHTRPFRTFSEVRNDLTLKELTLEPLCLSHRQLSLPSSRSSPPLASPKCRLLHA